MSAEREIALERARILCAAHPDAVKVEIDATDRATLVRGSAHTALRMRPGALPFKDGALSHLVAVGVLWSAIPPGDPRLGAFREIVRALAEGGSFVYGEADADGALAKEHVALREVVGVVPAPMDTIPELSHVPWRLTVSYKPFSRYGRSAERRHERD